MSGQVFAPMVAGSGLMGVRGLQNSDPTSNSIHSGPRAKTGTASSNDSGMNNCDKDTWTVIGHQDVLTGNLLVRQHIRVDGQVIGSISASQEATVEVSASGFIKGNILKLKNILIDGRVEGNLNAEAIFLRGDAVVHGEVSCRQLSMESTVTLIGKLVVASDPPFPQVDDYGHIVDSDTSSASFNIETTSINIETCSKDEEKAPESDIKIPDDCAIMPPNDEDENLNSCVPSSEEKENDNMVEVNVDNLSLYQTSLEKVVTSNSSDQEVLNATDIQPGQPALDTLDLDQISEEVPAAHKIEDARTTLIDKEDNDCVPTADLVPSLSIEELGDHLNSVATESQDRTIEEEVSVEKLSNENLAVNIEEEFISDDFEVNNFIAATEDLNEGEDPKLKEEFSVPQLIAGQLSEPNHPDNHEVDRTPELSKVDIETSPSLMPEKLIDPQYNPSAFQLQETGGSLLQRAADWASTIEVSDPVIQKSSEEHSSLSAPDALTISSDASAQVLSDSKEEPRPMQIPGVEASSNNQSNESMVLGSSRADVNAVELSNDAEEPLYSAAHEDILAQQDYKDSQGNDNSDPLQEPEVYTSIQIEDVPVQSTIQESSVLKESAELFSEPTSSTDSNNITTNS